jgi:uncharacterized repeat protein (TIGR03803 family)
MQEPCHWKKANVVFLLCITAVTASSGQTLNTLATFNLSNGASPQHMTLVQGHDGNFYGTTYYGGKNPNGGTVFRITPGGTLSTIHSFCWEGDDCGDGSGPLGGLLLATDGNFYGATEQGGNAICPYGCGTVFRVIPDIFSVAITPGGKLTTLHSFDYTDGAYPVGTLIQANNGNFYGTTYSWGTKAFGTVFQITPTGILTTLHNFAGLPDDGANPDVALVQSADGNFYGTTPFGGSGTSCDAGCGTIFKIAQDGKLTILHNFNYADGAEPIGGLVQAAGGNFYGTTSSGAKGFGTFFRITPTGELTTLYSFCAKADFVDGGIPVGTVIQGTDGNFYGTTVFVGPSNTCRWTRTAPKSDLRIWAALVLVRAGDPAPTEKLIGELDKEFPKDTFVQGTYLPTLRAAVALEHKDPSHAIDSLKPAGRFDFGGGFGFYQIYLRGDAYLASRDGKAAAAEFQRFRTTGDRWAVIPWLPWPALVWPAPTSCKATQPRQRPSIRTSSPSGKTPIRMFPS